MIPDWWPSPWPWHPDFDAELDRSDYWWPANFAAEPSAIEVTWRECSRTCIERHCNPGCDGTFGEDVGLSQARETLAEAVCAHDDGTPIHVRVCGWAVAFGFWVGEAA